jgi:hypothetical protein
VAEAVLQGDETQGLADATQGDEQGALIGGGIKEAVQPGIDQVQARQKGGEIGLVLLQALPVQGAGQMFGVAAQGRGTEAKLLGQDLVGHTPGELAVDFRALGMIADGATFVHGFPVFRFPFSIKAWGKVIRERGKGPEKMGRMTGKRGKSWKEFDRLLKIILTWVQSEE